MAYCYANKKHQHDHLRDCLDVDRRRRLQRDTQERPADRGERLSVRLFAFEPDGQHDPRRCRATPETTLHQPGR